MTNEASIAVSRPRSGVFFLRRFTVRVDGSVVARLGRGRSTRIEVEPGHHTIRAGVDWTRSLPLDVDLAESDEVAIQVLAPWSALWRTWISPHRALAGDQIGSPSP